MSFTVKADSSVVLSKTYSAACFKQPYTGYLKLLTEQFISGAISSLKFIQSVLSLLT